MRTVREDTFFHLRGRHVQHAHGRSSPDEGEHLSGAMIALMPTEEDAKRLKLSGGEKAENLHLTLYFLGEGADWSEGDRTSLTDSVISYVGDHSPGLVSGNVFGVNHWNGIGDNPCWVLAVGDLRGEDRKDRTLLDDIRGLATRALDEREGIPEQFTPWVPHICVAYTGDDSLLPELQKRLGEVEFDRIRVAFAGEYTDISLEPDALTAAAPPLRRNLNQWEIRSGTDFARIQSEWESAVDAALNDIAPIRDSQRERIVAQVFTAAETDNMDSLRFIEVPDEDMYSVLIQHMTEAANQAGEEQQRSAEEQGVSVPEWSLDGLTAAVGIDLLRSIAQVTARVISDSFIGSAVRRALSVLGRPAVSPQQAADDVDEHLRSLSEASVRDSVGGAITAAQNEGRRVVLSVAPDASAYVASEVLDRNVCSPCRGVDGQEFGTLADATEQYPSGGYRDCQGGVRCRGTIVAVWDE